ncbi:MAG TPA: GNAT family N-acetyltransferase [Acidimicrobiales bacterium]|nr:GNAT family N-acetyltransferase [Acidimicrobiales bacterium]
MASSRHRLGVALLLDEPVRSEVEGLRRAVGDPSLGRMDPHVTLVPPVNVRPAELPAALSTVRSAAASQQGPIVAALGPPATFMPHNPVLYLEVGGELERLAELRDKVFEPPLARALTWPWIPHVTLGDGIAEERITASLAVMGDYASLATFDRVVLLEEQSGRRWAPLADAYLGPPAVVGTGGMTVTITRSRLLDPEARSVIAVGFDVSGPVLSGPIVLTARTQDGVAGAAGAWMDSSGAHAGVFVSEPCRRQGIGSHLLAHLESTARDIGWDCPALQAEGPAGFYESRSAWVRAPGGTMPATRTRRTSSGRAS